MPEPSNKEVADDIYSRDVDDPFSGGEGKAKVIDRIKFLFMHWFGLSIIGRGLFCNQLSFTDYCHRYYAHGSGYFIQKMPITGTQEVFFVVVTGRYFGWRPQAYCYRMIVILTLPRFFLMGVF